MKLVYAAELHGAPQAYAALSELAVDQQAIAVVLGGDLFAYHTTAGPQIVFAKGTLRIFAHRLRARSIQLLVIPGNVDRPASIDYLHSLQDEAQLSLLNLQPHELSDPRNPTDAVHLIGYPFVPLTQFQLKDHERRDLASDGYRGPRPVLISGARSDCVPVETAPDHLDRLLSIEEELGEIEVFTRPTILVAHSPPFGGALDLVNTGFHAGSRAIRDWIYAGQPLLALHGHIHEAPEEPGQRADVIGRTLCINPGPAYRP